MAARGSAWQCVAVRGSVSPDFAQPRTFPFLLLRSDVVGFPSIAVCAQVQVLVVGTGFEGDLFDLAIYGAVVVKLPARGSRVRIAR